MSAIARKVMQRFYRQADGRPERLPWHREEPGRLLAAAVDARSSRGRALDVGCGARVLTLGLASPGMQATGIDLFPEAIAMARAQAEMTAGPVELVATDLFTYAPGHTFELIFDSGCLHSLVGGSVDAYKAQV